MARCYGHPLDQTGQGATAVDRAPAGRRLRQQRRVRAGSARSQLDLVAQVGRVASSRSITAASTSVSHAMLSRWWSSVAPGHGTRIDGIPVTATSCTVLAPPRPTSRSAAA